MTGFEEVEHTADWAFRARGRDWRELLENAARGMAALDRAGATGEPTAVREIEVQGVDRETLLINWLNEILYLEQSHREVYDRFQVFDVSDGRLRARLYGRPAAGRASHIKAATFHGLEVKQIPEGLEATVVVDV